MDTENIKTCILIRHGATAANEAGKYNGRGCDEDLSEAGIRKISEECEHIRKIAGNCKVFSGPLRRCTHTAGILFPGHKVHIINELTEIDFGCFEGKTIDQLKTDENYLKWIKSGGIDPPPGGEGREEFIIRSFNGFRKAFLLSENENMLIICHGGNIMAVMSYLTCKGYFDFYTGNLEGYVLRIRDDHEGISVISYDRIGCGDNT